MKAVVTLVCATVLLLPAHAQMSGGRTLPARPMGARVASVSRLGVRPMPRPTTGFGMVQRFPGTMPPAVRQRGVIITSLPFNPFFHNRFFINGGFFHSPFCFRNPFFCHNLFLRRFFFFSNFGAFNTFPISAFPVVASPPWVADPVPADTSAMQQESAALAELRRDLQEERLRREDLERELGDLRTTEVRSTPVQPQSEPETGTLPTILVFRDGTRTEVQNYAIVGKTLFAFTPRRTKKILIPEVNVPATIKANDERGVEFHLPRPGQAITHP